ncbi:MAG TPA: hypothetical protein VFB55_12800 [Verrucomicrobiae bacterium]|nr:hypothetical protein [Verrucomicrobiae bacterium]
MAGRLFEADMNENEHQFQALRQLLALKRHEVPPPGYFDRFSGEVLARIRAGETGGRDNLAERLPWLVRLLQALESQPAFAGALASALCLLLVGGLLYAERPDATIQPLLLPPGGAPALNVAVAPPLSAPPAVTAGLISATNPVFNPQPMATPEAVALFGNPTAPLQPVSFRVSGN